MGWESHALMSELTGLQFNDRGTCRHAPKGVRSSVLVETGELAFRVVAPGDLTSDERDGVVKLLSEKVTEQERRDLDKLHLLHAMLKSIATRSHTPQSPAVSINRIIKQYFSEDGLHLSDLVDYGISEVPPSSSSSSSSEVLSVEEESVAHDVALLVARHSDQQFTGRAIARIFHGIPSPRFPALVWGAQRGFWRQYLHIDFSRIMNIVTGKLLELRE